MCPARRIAARVAACALIVATCVAAAAEPPGPISVVVPAPQVRADGPGAGAVPAVPPDRLLAPEAAPTITFRWPTRRYDWGHLVNYVDLDPTPGLLDYGCGTVTYDGHRGDDIYLESFVEMDEGRFVVAGAPGSVVWVEDSYYDRNTAPNSFPVNYVHLRHDDGSESLYFHLRTWSTLVATGQRVFAGQPLGLVGSSGNSSDPHLHFEIQDASAAAYEAFAGPCRTGSSYWTGSQTPYVASNPMQLVDAGTMLFPPDGYSIKFRPPDVRHVRQEGATVHYFWIRFTDAHDGDVSRVTYFAPDESIYADWSHTHTGYTPFDWLYFQTFLPESGSLGTWRLEYRINGALAATKFFTYDSLPYQDPQGTPRAIAVSRGIVRGPLRGLDADSDLREFNVTSPPAHGRIDLSGARQGTFSYLPGSGFTGGDAFQFEVVDGEGRTSAPATITLDVTARQANALRLDGDGDYVSVPGNGSLDVGPGMTIEGWIRRTAGSNKWQQIVDRRNPLALDEHGVNLFTEPGSRLVLAIGTGTTRWYCYSTTTIPLRRWVHVAASWDGTWQRLYLDGVEDPNVCFFPGPISYSGVSETRIGGSFGTFEWFRGEIQDLRIFAEARSAAQVRADMGCAFADAPLPASLRARWRLLGSGTDDSGNGNAGALVGGAVFARTDAGYPLACAGQDLDGDGVPDPVDRCPFDAAAGGDDADGDGIGDACDNCVARRNAGQADADDDGIGDACDLCPFAGDTEQFDSDGDGAGDACDLAPTDAGEATPGDAIALGLAHDGGSGTTAISWSAEPRAASYELFRATLEEVRAAFFGTNQNPRDPVTSDRDFSENESPAPGSAFFYLVRGVSPGGARGLAGTDAAGRARDLQALD